MLTALETSSMSAAVTRRRTGRGDYLLSGMLRTPTGDMWEGSEGKYYRTRGSSARHVRCDAIDDALIRFVVDSAQSIDFARVICEQAKAMVPTATQPLKELQARIAAVAVQIDKAQNFMLEADEPAAWIRKIDILERERRGLTEAIHDARENAEHAASAASITPEAVLLLLKDQTDRIIHAPKQQQRSLIQGMIAAISLDPETLRCTLDWRMPESSIN